MNDAVISRGLHGWPRQDLALRRKGAKKVLAGELSLCGLLAVGLLTFVFSTWRRGEETRNNHQAGFAALRSLREYNNWGLAVSRSRAEAQRRKDLASLLLALRKTIGIIGVGVIGIIGVIGEGAAPHGAPSTLSTHPSLFTNPQRQAGFAALRSWRENNHWAHRCLLTGIDIITLTYDLATGCTPVRGRGTPLGVMRGAGRRSTERAIALKQLCCVMGVVDQRADDALLGGDPRRKACGGGGH